jgi:glycosyltransferase involved in cell wall biosynthesis
MIALITPTGCREEQINICAFLMKRQTYTGKVLWIIVDDGIPVTTNEIKEEFRSGWTIVKIHPVPAWRGGENTQGRNIAAGINFLKDNFTSKEIQAIFIIEDDDYYKIDYLDRMVLHLPFGDIIGETKTIYYNVQWRRFCNNNNLAHASLFQTAFKWNVIPIFERTYSERFIDCVLWRNTVNKHLFFENYLGIGMKGMPGRQGIGAGHTHMKNMLTDTSMTYLSGLIGNDYKMYEHFYTPQRK